MVRLYKQLYQVSNRTYGHHWSYSTYLPIWLDYGEIGTMVNRYYGEIMVKKITVIVKIMVFWTQVTMKLYEVNPIGNYS
jgi:hypothetical protein